MGTGVVLVDDHADVVALMRALVEMGADHLQVVGSASSGPEAIAVVDDLDPALVVLDHNMPAMTGLEAAAVMLDRHPGLRILLCSAYLDDDIKAKAHETGIRCCLSKDRIMAIAQKLEALAAA